MLLNVSLEKKLSSDICNKTSTFCLLDETASLLDKAESSLHYAWEDDLVCRSTSAVVTESAKLIPCESV